MNQEGTASDINAPEGEIPIEILLSPEGEIPIEILLSLKKSTGEYRMGISGPADIFTLYGMLSAANLELFKRASIAEAQARAQHIAGVTPGGIVVPGPGNPGFRR